MRTTDRVDIGKGREMKKTMSAENKEEKERSMPRGEIIKTDGHEW